MATTYDRNMGTSRRRCPACSWDDNPNSSLLTCQRCGSARQPTEMMAATACTSTAAWDPDTQETETILNEFTFQGENPLAVIQVVQNKRHITPLLRHAKDSHTVASLKAIWMLMVLAKESSPVRLEMASYPCVGFYTLYKVFKSTHDSDSIRKTLVAMAIAYLIPALDATILADMGDAIAECMEYLSRFQPVQFDKLQISGEDIHTALTLGYDGMERMRQQEDIPSIVNRITAHISDDELVTLAQKERMEDLLHLCLEPSVDPSKVRQASWLLMTIAQQSLFLRSKILHGFGLQMTCLLFQNASIDPPDMALQGLAAMTVVYLLPSLGEAVELAFTDEIKCCLDYLRNMCSLSVQIDGNMVTIEEIRTMVENRIDGLYTRHVWKGLPVEEVQNLAAFDSKPPPKDVIGKRKPHNVKERELNALEPFHNNFDLLDGFRAESQADYRSFKTMMKEKDSLGLFQWVSSGSIQCAINTNGQNSGQNDMASLLKELPACANEPSRQLQVARILLKFAEKDPDARDQMIEHDAITYLLLAFTDKHEGNRELQTTVALTVAYILRSFYPRKIPSLTKGKRQAIFRMLDFLRDSKQGIAMEGTEISAQALAYVAAQARNYFTLLDSSNDSTSTLGSNSTDHATSPRLRAEWTFGSVEALGIESCLFFLGSTDKKRKLNAVMALMKIAKDSPTQRALMHNYGVATRLADIVRSVDDETLKIAAAFSLAYIMPTLDSSILASALNEAQESLQILEACDNNGLTIDGVKISSQEIEWAIECLRNISEPIRSAMAEGTNVKMLRQGKSEQFWKPFLGEAPAGSIILSNLDLKALFLEKKVAALVDLLRFRSCRMLDAALLLVALVEEDKKIGKVSLSSENLSSLLGTFYHWASTSDELRLAVAVVVCRLEPLSPKLPSELQPYMSACIEFIQGKNTEAQRVVARALYKVNAAQFKFEPTSYNYIQDSGFARTIQANSLGIVCHSVTWTWDGILDCVQHTKSGKAVRISSNDPQHSSVTFNMQDQFVAMQLVEDVLGRLKARNSGLQSGTANQRTSIDAFVVPRNLNISVADRPEFLGVSVFHLAHCFLQEVKDYPGLSDRSNFYEIENLNSRMGFVRRRGQYTVCPIDGKLGAAYVHCLQGQDHVGLANHMLSWTWSYSVRDVVNTLSEYCKNNSYDPKRVYVWICCLCLNQHRIVERDKSGIESNESTVDLENEFKSRVIGIGRVLVMMRPWGDPENLKRVWCIFECFMALDSNCEFFIVMPPRESDHMAIRLFPSFGNTSDHGIDSLYKALNNIDVAKAEASQEQDRVKILGLIRERMGFQKVNMLVRDRLREWVRSVIDSLVELRARVEQDPVAEDDDPTHYSRLLYCKFLKQVGDVYDHYGDYPAAHQMCQKCLFLRQSVQGTDHLDVAEAFTDLGRTLFSRGSFLHSWDMYMEALRIRENHGSDHLNTARTYFHVGQLLQELGNMDEAKTMMERCLAIQQHLGSDRDAAKTRSHIALLLGESDVDANQHHALEMAHEARRILSELAGEDHPDTAFCYGVIARILQHINVEEALSLIGQCEAIQERAYGSRHPSLFMTYTLHGDILRLQCSPEYAYEEYCKALNIGSSPVSIARTYANMSVVASVLQRHDEAVELHDGVLAILEASPQMMDQKLVLIYSSAGEDLFDRQEYSLAVVLFRRGLEVMEAMLGKDHPDLAPAHEAVALALYCNRDYAGAFLEYERLRKRTYNRGGHP